MEPQVQRDHIQLAPLCACGHMVSPLDASYVKACCTNCPLRNRPERWAALLLFALEAKGLLTHKE